MARTSWYLIELIEFHETKVGNLKERKRWGI